MVDMILAKRGFGNRVGERVDRGVRNGNTTRVVHQVMAPITNWNWWSVHLLRDARAGLGTVSRQRMIDMLGIPGGVHMVNILSRSLV